MYSGVTKLMIPIIPRPQITEDAENTTLMGSIAPDPQEPRQIS